MIVQGPALVMTALGSLGQPSRWLGPPLEDGVHLRWAFRPSRRFPANGFAIYRRRHFPGTLVDLPDGNLAASPVQLPELARRAVIDLVVSRPLPGQTTPVRVEGLFQGVPVAVVTRRIGRPPLPRDPVTSVELEADAIDSARVVGHAQVRRLRYVPATQSHDVAWQLLTRVCLPLTSPTYPCHQGSGDPDGDWNAARARLPQGDDAADLVAIYLGAPPPTQSNAGWTGLYQAMTSLFGMLAPARFRLPPLQPGEDGPSALIEPVDLFKIGTIDGQLFQRLVERRNARRGKRLG
jgi:hypothetical protein